MSLLSRPHHDPSERWVDNPTPEPGEIVVVTLDLPAGCGFDRAQLRHVHDGEAAYVTGTSEAGAAGTVIRFGLPCHNPVVNYRFWLGGPGGARWLNGRGVIDHDPTDHDDFRLLTTGGTPRWVPETVWYQIFPDRFASTGDHLGDLPDWAWRSEWTDPVATGADAMTQIYGGDLDGITERLDHVVRLGVGGVFINPVFPARSNHRYDALSFDEVDPLLGGDAALARLSDACHRAGLRIVTDLTLNHTGDAHDWFVAAQADADSEEAGYYYFLDHPDEYESWLGVRSLPKLDHSSEPLRRRFYDGPDSVLARFLRPPLNMDGWRIDVANMTGRFRAHDHNAMVRTAARRTGDAIDTDKWLLGEHFFDASLDVRGEGWHGVMNYAGASRPIASWVGRPDVLAAMMPGPGQDLRDGEQVAAALDAVRAAMPWQSVLGSMALLSSHDTPRWSTMARSPELAMVGFGFLLGLPGSPCFFYGDEIGLAGTDNEQSRVPMPWDETAWDPRVLSDYRALISLRGQSSALAHGGFRWVEQSADALTFLRESRDERLLVRMTRSPAPALDAPELDLGDSETLFGPNVTEPATAASISFVRL